MIRNPDPVGCRSCNWHPGMWKLKELGYICEVVCMRLLMLFSNAIFNCNNLRTCFWFP
jgi:hypothetical protein